jgi:predicted RND superfamily exporter protein
MSDIKTFEEERLPTLPFIITVESRGKNFSDEAVMQRLIAFENNLRNIIPGEIVASAPSAFHEFVAEAPDAHNPNLFAQFMLANSFMDHSFSLWSSDRMQSTFVISIPLRLATQEMRTMIKDIHTIGNRYPEFSVAVSGKISDFDHFIALFVKEFFTGLLVTLAATALFFWFYCKNIVSIVSIVLSAIFSLGILTLFHLLFNMPITLLTLLNVILYAGLIADSLIQLFVCYKREGDSCERSVLEPIFVSNVSILICLVGMFFVGGMMAAFAFDLAILLAANVIFILWITPSLHRRYLRACNE